MQINCFKWLLFTLIWLFLAGNPVLSQGHWHQMSDSPAYLSHQGAKCAMPYYSEALQSGDKAFFRQMAAEQSKRNSQEMLTYLSPSGHFEIHYDTTGFDAIPLYDRNDDGTPDYLQFVAQAFDRAWEVEIDSLGFQPPLDINGNPKLVYEIFCEDLGNLYGVTEFFTNQDIPSIAGFNFPSTIVLNTDFSFVEYPDITDDAIIRDSLAIAVTGAHEFNHALQLGYRIWFENDNINSRFRDLWFLEASATYMEEVVAGEVNDYLQYLDDFFETPYLNVAADRPGLRIYGQSIFYMMLDDTFGAGLLREAWEQNRNESALPALQTVLADNGGSLADEWRRLAQWMYYTGSRAVEGQFFHEADLYPEISFNLTPSYNGTDIIVAEDSLPPMSFRYYRTTRTTTGDLDFRFRAFGTNSAWSASFATRDGSFFREVVSGASVFADFNQTGSMLDFVVISDSRDGLYGDARESYEVRLAASDGESAGVTAAPNIIRPTDQTREIQFQNLPPGAAIEIFNANGLRIATVGPTSGGGLLNWNLESFGGEPVGSGIYIYKVVADDQEFDAGKIMIIR